MYMKLFNYLILKPASLKAISFCGFLRATFVSQSYSAKPVKPTFAQTCSRAKL